MRAIEQLSPSFFPTDQSENMATPTHTFTSTITTTSAIMCTSRTTSYHTLRTTNSCWALVPVEKLHSLNIASNNRIRSVSCSTGHTFDMRYHDFKGMEVLSLGPKGSSAAVCCDSAGLWCTLNILRVGSRCGPPRPGVDLLWDATLSRHTEDCTAVVVVHHDRYVTVRVRTTQSKQMRAHYKHCQRVHTSTLARSHPSSCL